MPFLRAAALALPLAALSLPVVAEEQVACTMLGCEKVNIEVPDFAGADNFSVTEVWSVVNDILGVSGLAPNFQVVETQEVGNAAAVIIEEQRYLAFNPIWMRTYRDRPDSKWQLYAVMAHEVGHHLQGHTISAGGSRPPTELEADEYAGFTLAALGATLEQTQALWKSFGEQGSATHPPRHQRLDAVQRGWDRRSGSSRPASAPVPAAIPQPNASLPPSSVGDICKQLQSRLGPVRVCTSSTLDQQKGNSYALDNMFDNDARTAWVEGASGNGIGQQITFSFQQPTTISALSVINGYAKSTKSYTENSRVQMMALRTSTGVSGDLTLEDVPEWQRYTLTGLDNLTWLALTISSVYSGSKWQDTALSEFILE